MPRVIADGHKIAAIGIPDEEVARVAIMRQVARANQLWTIADSARDALKRLGFTTNDSKDGFTLI